MTAKDDGHEACRAALAEAQATIDALELQLVAYDALDGQPAPALKNELHKALERAYKASLRSSLVRAAERILSGDHDQLNIFALSLRGHTLAQVARTRLTSVERVRQLLGAAERRLAQAILVGVATTKVRIEITKCGTCERVLKVNEAIMDARLEDIFDGKLSVRVRNAFYYGGGSRPIVTVKDLLQRTPSDLLKLKHFGRQSLQEVEDCMASIGLRVGGSIKGARQP